MTKLLFSILFVATITGCVDMGTQGHSDPTFKKTVKETNNKVGKSEAGDGLRKRLMVLPFLDQTGKYAPDMRDKARGEVIKELNKTQEIIVIDTRDLKTDVTKIMKGDDYDLTEISKLANTLGVSAVLDGKILDIKVHRKADEVGLFRQMKTVFECTVNVKVVSSKSAKELFNVSKTVTVEESNVRVLEKTDSDKFFAENPEILEDLVKEAFLEFTPQIIATLDKVSWEGRIAMITGDRIFLNVGKISGLQIGDILKVTDQSEEVYDPQTGKFIGAVSGRVKGTLEVVSFFGQDGAISVIHSGSSFKENDKIELY